MGRALEALRRYEEKSGQILYSILLHSLKEQPPSAAEIATQLSAELGKKVTENWVGQRKKLARDKLVELLRQEVAGELAAPTTDGIDGELAAVGLLEFCRRRKRGGAAPQE